MILRTHENKNCALRRLVRVSRLMEWPLLRGTFILLCLAAALANRATAQTTDPADLICSRSAPGSLLPPPPDLCSQSRVLEVNFTIPTTVDEQGLTRYCSPGHVGQCFCRVKN
jgi:hypothetical protein